MHQTSALTMSSVPMVLREPPATSFRSPHCDTAQLPASTAPTPPTQGFPGPHSGDRGHCPSGNPPWGTCELSSPEISVARSEQRQCPGVECAPGTWPQALGETRAAASRNPRRPSVPLPGALTLPRGAGATQWAPREERQHFWSPGQSVSSVHGEAGASGPTAGQAPGLEANSLDRFRAGGKAIGSQWCRQQALHRAFPTLDATHGSQGHVV